MRTNSPISDPEPTVPALTGLQRDKPKPKESDYEKLANSKHYPEIMFYLDKRIQHFQRFTPGGENIEKLTKKERVDAWDSAVIIISEFESLKRTLEAYKKK